MRHKDLTGQKFNMLTVKSFAFIRETHAYWNCICDCGKETIVSGSKLIRGITKSCGCLGRTVSRKRMTTNNGYSKTRIYRIYIGIKRRCCNPNDKSYPYYGGRGIKICDEWLKDSKVFIEWAKSSGYNDNLSIDRIDVNGNYEPKNCRWVTAKSQANNRTNNLFITFKGKTMTAAEWCESKGWNRHIIPERLRKGWSLEKSMTTPLRTRGGSK